MADLVVRVLGPVGVEVGGAPVSLGGPRQRAVLAMLVCARRGAVSLDGLADGLWGDHLPPSAATAIRAYVSRLRRVLQPDRPSGDRAAVLPGRAAGYTLRLSDDEVDAWLFERQLRQAQHLAAIDPARARNLVCAALDLWRGPAFAEFADRHWAFAERVRLTELRLAGHLLKVTLDLRLGEFTSAITDAELLTSEHPLREEAWRLLSLAQWADNRQADALATLRRCRRVLVAETGLDPGQAIAALERAVLAGDTEALVRMRDPVETAAPTVPHQLPSAVPGFVGRRRLLGRLDELAGRTEGSAAHPTVVVLSGTAGVGKTSVAVQWGHRARIRFADGQLYADLGGFDVAGTPRDPHAVVREFLAALVPGQHVPAEPAAQVGLYRSVLSGRQVLIVLDNAGSAEQVRPLLPGAPGCLVLVTSRHRLTGLIATDAAHLVEVDVPSEDEARELLGSRLGARRLAEEPAAARDIIERCGRLPIGLVVVAARIAMRADAPLASVSAETDRACDGAHLDPFETGDPRTDLRSVFSWSYRLLRPAAARLFRLLGVHRGADITVAAAASLAGSSVRETRRLLVELTDAYMIVEHRPDRYRQHELLGGYAAELVHRHETDTRRREAVHRLLDHYLHTAHAAALRLHPHRLPIVLASARPGVIVATVDDPHHWFTDEQAVLLTLVESAARHGFDVHAWQLAWTMTDLLDRRGHWEDLLDVQRIALAAARRLGDPQPQAHAHRALGRALVHAGRFDEAVDQYRQAIDMFRLAGDRTGQGHAHLGHGWALVRMGRIREAAAEDRRALALFEEVDDRLGKARALNHLGVYHTRIGRYTQALRDCWAALALFDEIGDRMGQASTNDSLADVCQRLGRVTDAVHHYTLSADLLRAMGNRYYQAQVLDRLGDAHLASGAPEPARAAWCEAAHLMATFDDADADRMRAKCG
jgi:DNA-binding SARP family transcriptional activator